MEWLGNILFLRMHSMGIRRPFDDLLKNPRPLPDRPAIAVHLKGGRGGILFEFDGQSHKLTSGHHILPHSGALAGYDVAAVVEEARERAAILADKIYR
jgi:hypothetical protein